MKNFNLKSFVSGMTVMALLSTTVAFAAPVLTNLQVYTGTIKKIMINGVDKTPSEQSNPELQPFIYNDRTYIPLRYISENLFKNVGWNGDTGTITIDGVNVPTIEASAITTAVNLNMTHMQNEDLVGYMSDLSIKLDSSVLGNTRDTLQQIFDNYNLSSVVLSRDIVAFDGTNADVRIVTETRKIDGSYPYTNNKTTSVIKLVKESGKWKLSYSYIEKLEGIQ